MSAGEIPPSIRDALESTAGYVLLVAGKPGTGKSLFVQEIFREFTDSFIVLSNAEATSFVESDISNERHIVAQYWREIQEESLHEFSVKEQCAKLLGKETQCVDSSIVIIDSWTDFLMPVPDERKYEILQSLIYAARKEGKKLILVYEGDFRDPTMHKLEHSADAIIRLEKLSENQRMYRQVSIEKMRSRSISQDTFLFTLNNGHFSYIPWHKHQFPPIMVQREPILDPSKEKVSTGNQSLDGILGGGFDKGMLSLIEVENLAAPYLETIYIPFLSNHLNLGRPAVILLPEGWSPDRFMQGLGHFVDPDSVEKQVVFFGRHVLSKHENVRSIDDDPWKTLQEIRYEATQLEREFKTQATELFSLNTLENKYGITDVKGIMAEMTAALPTTQRATLTILSKQQALKSGSVAHSIHLKVQELSGVLSIFGIIPRTNFLAVRPMLQTGFFDYELIPIV
ncbi:MAG: ATPase domain-containing protein [Candidatus Thorarchaeota archaeon]